jgi:hypothetical protein
MTTQRSARPSSGILPIASDGLGLTVEVSGTHIVVQTAKGAFRVTYQKVLDYPQLILESEWCAAKGKQSPATLAKFRTRVRTRAWRLANDVVNELGWFGLA